MHKRVVGVLALVAVLVAGAVYSFARGRSESKLDAPTGRSAKIDLPQLKADAKAQRGITPRWSYDVDPEGPLRLEGQVVDTDGHGVGGAEVWLGSVPPRS